jgi:hypothetical protein
MKQLFFSEREFYPGQEIACTFVFDPSTNLDSYFGIKIFEVTSSYANDMYKFNNTTLVYHGNIYDAAHNNTIYWTNPGLYQVVLYSYSGTVIVDVSNVFELKGIDSFAQVTASNTSYHFGQKVLLTIARPNGTIFDSSVFATVRPVKNASTAYAMQILVPLAVLGTV